MSELEKRRPNWGKKEWLEFSELQRREIQSVKKELERLNYWKGLENEIMDREDKVLAIEKDNERLREALEQAEAKIEAQAEYIMTANRVNNNLKKQLEE